MVVPGQGTTQSYYSLKLASTFNGQQVDPSQYYNVDSPTTITGVTTGVTATVIGFKAATTTDQQFLQMVRTLLQTLRLHIQHQVMLRPQHLLQHTLLNILQPMVQLLHNLQVLKGPLQGQVLPML